MRAPGGTNFELVLSVVALTNSTIALLAAPSFHEGRRSVCVTPCVKARPATNASTMANSRRTCDFMVFRARQRLFAQSQFQMRCERPPAAFGGSPPHGGGE